MTNAIHHMIPVSHPSTGVTASSELSEPRVAGNYRFNSMRCATVVAMVGLG